MFRYNKRVLERIIARLGSDGCAIIVEGKRDRESLEILGIARYRILEAAQSNYRTVERALRRRGFRSVAPLFDFDPTGRTRMSRFLEYFEGTDIKIINSYWFSIRNLRVASIEELDNIYRK